MIEAILKGQLSREQENMEDILTSNVFGLLQYLPPSQGLLPFLAKARTAGNNAPLSHFAEEPVVSANVAFRFWPTCRAQGCNPSEPDLELWVQPEGSEPILIYVEAKYLSGKSSEASNDSDKPWDQLAREWDNLVTYALARKCQPCLIYLTADAGFPYADIRASEEEFRRLRPRKSPPEICWLSWRHLYALTEKSSNLILSDLHRLLSKMELHFFDGIVHPKAIQEQFWTFGSHLIKRRRKFAWAGALTTISIGLWSFDAKKRLVGQLFDWSTSVPVSIDKWEFSL